MLDYEALKAMAKGFGRPVKDLLALAPINDPFYAGVASRRRDAEWFAAIWADHGAAGSHLRRLHYQLVSSAVPIRKPDGSVYQNTEADWNTVITASLAARYLGLVPFDGLVDRRNDEPMIFAANLEADPDRESEVSCEVSGGWADVEVPDMPDLPFLWVNGLNEDRDATQDYIVEVWIEKSTQNDWLIPLCRRRGVNLVVGIGEQEEASDLWQDIVADLEEQLPDLSDVEVPRSQAPGETDRFVLFDSRRDYLTQMDAYNAWRDGDEAPEP